MNADSTCLKYNGTERPQVISSSLALIGKVGTLHVGTHRKDIIRKARRPMKRFRPQENGSDMLVL